MVEDLVAELHGTGGTRLPVDSGWVGLSQQIGQTGKTVHPEFYVALGISGEVQHRVGFAAARTVVAINADPDSPIARFADLMVMGDLHAIVPLLIERIRAARRA